MTKRPWFRMYSEVLTDRKLMRAARIAGQPKAVIIGVWTILLSLASESPERGVLLLAEDMPLTDDEIQDETGLDSEAFNNVMEALQSVGVIERGGEALCITQWHKRQFESDDSTERVRRYRQRQRAEEEQKAAPASSPLPDAPPDHPQNAMLQACNSNDDVTLRPDSNVTLQKRYSNGGVTPPDTESETDFADANASGAGPPPAPPEKSPKTPDQQPDNAQRASQVIAGLAASMTSQGASLSGSGRSPPGNGSPKPKPRRKRPSRADPRTTRAEIQRYRAVTGRLPPKVRYDDVIDALAWCTDEQAAAVYRRWKQAGYNPANPDWVEWAQRAHAPPSQGGSGNGRERGVT